jgi:hypothetical protein
MPFSSSTESISRTARARCAPRGLGGGAWRAGRRALRRAVFSLVGGVAVVAGVVMLVLPGPGLVTVAAGFGILGQEYAWAARVNDEMRARLVAAARTVRTSRHHRDDVRRGRGRR